MGRRRNQRGEVGRLCFGKGAGVLRELAGAVEWGTGEDIPEKERLSDRSFGGKGGPKKTSYSS
jgi:hypothetical protein